MFLILILGYFSKKIRSDLRKLRYRPDLIFLGQTFVNFGTDLIFFKNIENYAFLSIFFQKLSKVHVIYY
jgi:hypothetical protein